jgi:cation diffusion facilitator family transporter
MHEGNSKAIVAAFAANLGIAAAKLVGFAFTGAASMLAEAVHSLADCGNQGLLLLGAARAKRGPTSAHPFGHGRERYFWAFVVAVVLFILGGVFAITEGVAKLRHPHPLQSPLLALAILVFATVLETLSLRTALREASALRGEGSLWRFIHETKAAELPVILLEDMAALVGLLLALAGVSLSMLTGDARVDALGSIAIGVLLTLVAIVLASKMRSLLVGEAASATSVVEIRDALLRDSRLRRIIHLRTVHLSPDELLIAVKAEFDREITFAELAAEIDRVERRVRERLSESCVIYIEPDVWHDHGS